MNNVRNDGYYYDLKNDIENYKDDFIFCVIGGRNTGKTYSALRYCVENNIRFVFVKRTMDDVNLLCSGSGRIGQQHNDYGVDLSPFKSLNRDFGYNIRAFAIRDGLGGFWQCNEKDEPCGLPIGYLFALSAVQKFKGFDMSECSMIIFDEFIPPKWERVSKMEGELVMELYKTVSRDREHRGQEPLKLVCLANATNISNPLMYTLEIVNDVVDMQTNKESIRDISDRGILLHVLRDNEAFRDQEKQSAIYKAMSNTSWASMALESDFAYDDFTAVKNINLKGYQCRYKFHYRNKDYYIYMRSGQWYLCNKKSNHFQKEYDLDIENDQKLFFAEVVIDIRFLCIQHKVLFQNYILYDLIINYKKFFKL